MYSHLLIEFLSVVSERNCSLLQTFEMNKDFGHEADKIGGSMVTPKGTLDVNKELKVVDRNSVIKISDILYSIVKVHERQYKVGGCENGGREKVVEAEPEKNWTSGVIEFEWFGLEAILKEVIKELQIDDHIEPLQGNSNALLEDLE